MIRGALALAVLTVATSASAVPPAPVIAPRQGLRSIVAIAGPPSAAVVIGKTGETYEPDGKGAWIRRADGSIAGDVVAATRAGDVAVAEVAHAPPFERLHGGGWSVMNVGLHANALLGRGPRPTAAVGKAIFALEPGKATKLADAPAPVLAVAASAKTLVAETERGLARWEGAKWTPLAKAPHHVAVLLDPKWATVERGVVDLDTGKVTAWPAGFHPLVATSVGDAIYAASERELVTVEHGAASKDALPALASPVVAITAERGGRVLVATRAGQLAQRIAGTWTTTELRDAPFTPHDGPPPAESR